MGTKLQELRNGCFARAMDDEPMFVLLARDASAPQGARDWADRREADIRAGRKPASDMAMVQEARECADRMEAWRTEHDGEWRTGLFGGSSLEVGAEIEAVEQGLGHAPNDAHIPGIETADEGLRRGMLGKDA